MAPERPGDAAPALTEALQGLLRVLRQLKAEPALVYAALKTGHIVFQNVPQSFSAIEIAEWKDAIREFDRLNDLSPEQFGQCDLETRQRLRLATLTAGDPLA